mgnify:CR=1 FL=1
MITMALVILTGCGGTGLTDPGSGGGVKKGIEDPGIARIDLELVGDTEVRLAWSTTAPANCGVELGKSGSTEIVTYPPTWQNGNDFECRIPALAQRTDYLARVVLKVDQKEVGSSDQLKFTTGGFTGSVVKPNAVENSAIDVNPSGAYGVDFVIEPSYHDRKKDDRVVIYMKSTSTIALSRNASRDRDPAGGIASQASPVTFKIDRDEQGGDKYIGTGILGQVYSSPLDFRTMEYEQGVKVLGTLGHNGQGYGVNAEKTTARYWRGIQGPFKDEWHVLTAYQQDGWYSGKNGKTKGSDAIVIPLVLDPKTPVFQIEALKGGQFYTTPAKVYHIPHIHERTTYLDGKNLIHLFNLLDASAIQYRVDGGTWKTYAGPISAGQIFHKAKTAYDFEARIGTQGQIRKRTFHYLPGYPSLLEQHPSKLLFPSETARKAVLSWQQNSAYAAHKDAYSALVNYTFYSGMDRTYGQGIRRGWRAYMESSRFALRNAFVAMTDGVTKTYNGKRFADQAKDILLELNSVEPVGMENALWLAGPALERVVLGQEQVGLMDGAMAYDLLISIYREADGFSTGITEIEDIKIRDNLASQALTGLQFAGNNSNSTGEGSMHWGYGEELAMGTIAAVMPAYDSIYYGTSGADGLTKATHLNAPFPNQKVTWSEYISNPNVALPGHPGLRFPARHNKIYQNGVWMGAKNYDAAFTRYTPAFLNMMVNFVGPNHPFQNLDQYCATIVAGGSYMEMVVNNKFSYAPKALQNMGSFNKVVLRNVFGLCFYDPTYTGK